MLSPPGHIHISPFGSTLNLHGKIYLTRGTHAQLPPLLRLWESCHVHYDLMIYLKGILTIFKSQQTCYYSTLLKMVLKIHSYEGVPREPSLKEARIPIDWSSLGSRPTVNLTELETRPSVTPFLGSYLQRQHTASPQEPQGERVPHGRRGAGRKARGLALQFP